MVLNYRHDKVLALQSFLKVASFYLFIVFTTFYFLYPRIHLLKGEIVIALTFFGIWRYSWMILNYIRAFIYRYHLYPKLKKQISQLPLDKKYPKDLYFMIPSYKEEPWVSKETFKALIREVEKIPSNITVIVSTATKQEDEIIAQIFKANRTDKKINLIFQHQKYGKRVAMGHALRAISRLHRSLSEDDDSVTIFMDGDSYMENDFLKNLLPFFAIDKKLGALTTNEIAYINSKSKLYKEWFNLKFGQRHILFQSHSLSKKVMTLTGRLSAYKTNIIIKEDFIRLIENDILIHPLFGKFRFLMGDDKSSWFYLLKHKYNMLYIPDILCYSLESRDGDFFSISRSLTFRWNGNTLRNNARALNLGMKTTGIFIWFVILDQRLTMWTSLVGITSAIILSFAKSIFYLFFYIIWVIFIKVLSLFVISLGGHKVSFYTIPLMLYSQWYGSFVKINAYYDLANQNWSKNGEVQKNDKNIDMIKHPLIKIIPRIYKYSFFLLFIFSLILFQGLLKIPDLTAYNFKKEKNIKKVSNIIDLKSKGVGEKGVDNAKIINNIIKNTKPPFTLKLPPKNIDIYKPIIINKSNITFMGDRDKTVIISHIEKPYIGAIMIEGKIGKEIGFIKENISKKSTILTIKLHRGKKLSNYILIKQPNDKKFLKYLKSKRWNKKYPYLRQQIVKKLQFKKDENLLYIKKPITLKFDRKEAKLFSLKMVTNVHLKNFTIKQIVPNDDIKRYQFVYENRLPKYQVDLVRFDFASKSFIEKVKLLNAGRHSIVFENSYEILANNLYINGAWNKGKGGSGYFRIARSYFCEVKNSVIKNIRHLTLQWSSAGNYIHNLNMGVDINLHGGYSHDNLISSINFNIPKPHHWKAITHTPQDAKWAPPDGQNYIRNK